MANKFQKSVLQRLEEDAMRKKTAPESPTASGAEPKQSVGSAESSSDSQDVQTVLPSPVRQEEAPPPAASAPDLSAYLRPAPARRAKNKTFYLDTDVIEALQKAAKAQRVTDSKLCGDILRSVLGL